MLASQRAMRTGRTQPLSKALSTRQDHALLAGGLLEVEAPDAPEAAGLAVLSVLLLADSAPLEPVLGAAASPPPSARLRFPPDLKSVSYQPAPFKRNAGADTSLRNSAAEHAGQSINGESLNFWIASKRLLQALHSYS